MTTGVPAHRAGMRWAESHGALPSGHLGAGMLYYSLAYTMRAKCCVVLGSGGLFVPAMLVEAQRQLCREGAIDRVDVTVVDADVGPWGRPDWGDHSDLTELVHVAALTVVAARDWRGPMVDVLHVDADHTYEGCLGDLLAWERHLSPNAVITVHDTANEANREHHPPIRTWSAAEDFAHDNGWWRVVNLHVGAGVAILTRQEGF